MTARLLPLLLVAALAAAPPLRAQTMTPHRTGHADVDGVRLYYERYGEGPPLVLVGGLGTATWLWEHQIDDFAAHFTVIAFDNRGVGRSDAPPGPYTTDEMADDLAGLLEALAIDRAHVLGVSLGGFVAQSFALRHPARVDRLVLVSTSAGGAAHVPMDAEALALMLTADPDPEALVRRRLPLAFTDAYLADSARTAHLVAQRLALPQTPQGYAGQIAAGAAFDAADRVGDIAVPVLVAAGTADRVVPFENARRLAAALPDALLKPYEGLGHQFFVERPDAFNRDVVAFLLAD